MPKTFIWSCMVLLQRERIKGHNFYKRVLMRLSLCVYCTCCLVGRSFTLSGLKKVKSRRPWKRHTAFSVWPACRRKWHCCIKISARQERTLCYIYDHRYLWNENKYDWNKSFTNTDIDIDNTAVPPLSTRGQHRVTEQFKELLLTHVVPYLYDFWPKIHKKGLEQHEGQ